ncbi:hypothetical protein Tco_1047385 [Tanacetum coccineum]
MGYSFYYPPENKVLVARNAEFLENNLIDQEARGDLGEPANYKAALLDPESDKWLTAMNVEMQSMKDNEVWILVELPPNGKTVGSKWLFKKKTDMDGATLSNRILIAIAAYYDYEIWQMDVKTAFLNGYLNEELRLSKSQSASTPAELKRMQNVPYASAVGSIMVMLLRCDLALMVVANRSEHYQAENTMGHEFATSSTETGYVVLFEWRCCSDLEESQAKSIFRYFILQKLSILLPYASKEAVWVKKIHILGSCFSTIEKPINMYLIITGAIAYSY